MPEFDLDKLIGAMGDETTGKNVTSILGLLQEANKIIGELDKILAFAKKLEGNIIISAAVKMQAKKAGIELTPLSPENTISPASDTHKIILENINRLNPEQLKGLMEAIQRYDGESKANTRKPDAK